MAWEEELFALFDDLEQQARALHDAERSAELADRSRAAYAGVTLASRLMASVDRPVVVEIAGVGPVAGTVRRVGEGWLLLRAATADWVVRTDAVRIVRDPSDRSVPELAWSPVSRLGVGSALRRLADSGAPCVVHLVDGGRHEGVVGRVGRDFVEVEPTPEPPRSGAAGRERVALVSFAALAAVRSPD